MAESANLRLKFEVEERECGGYLEALPFDG